MPTKDQHIRTALSLFGKHTHRHDSYRLFSDSMELTALSIANSVDLRSREPREARYLEIIKRYERDTIDFFPRFFAEITLALEAGFADVLGDIFTRLEIHNRDRGQFFTPYPVCQMMARVTLGDATAARALMEEKGFLTCMEPACGAGTMVIALAEAMKAEGLNYQRDLHVTAVDVDPRVVHMAYIQFSLLHIPAEVRVGNSQSGEIQERWYTPAHILGGWSYRLAVQREATAHSASVPAEPAPAYVPPLAPEPPAAWPGKPRQLSLF